MRLTPYSDARLARTLCCRCRKVPATEQWSCKPCAAGVDEKRWFPLCDACDADLNEMVLTFLGWPHAAQLMRDYRAQVGLLR